MLISAVPEESDNVRGAIRRGIFNGRVVHADCGIGIANAAHTATSMLLKHSPSLVMLFGIAGAYPGSGLNIGDIAISEKEIYADFGVLLKSGFRAMDFIGIPVLRKSGKAFYNEYPADGRLLKKAINALSGFSPAIGVFLTVSQATGTYKRAVYLRRRYGAICENMEGASVAQICLKYGVSMIEIRAVSNIVEDRDASKWKVKDAAAKCQMAVMELVESFIG